MENLFPRQNIRDQQNAEPKESGGRAIDFGKLIAQDPEQEEEEKDCLA